MTQAVATADTPKPLPYERLLAIDLRSLDPEQMAALSHEAMRRGCSMSELLGQLVDEISRRILNPEQSTLPAAASSPSGQTPTTEARP